MNNIESVFEFITQNLITLSVIMILLIVLLIGFKLSKNQVNDKIANAKKHKLSNKDYNTFCENSKKAIVNTTLSFEASLCKNENEIDDMYSKTVLVGNKIIKKDGFKISSVGKI